jgi:hypothetical protein
MSDLNSILCADFIAFCFWAEKQARNYQAQQISEP